MKNIFLLFLFWCFDIRNYNNHIDSGVDKITIYMHDDAFSSMTVADVNCEDFLISDTSLHVTVITDSTMLNTLIHQVKKS